MAKENVPKTAPSAPNKSKRQRGAAPVPNKALHCRGSYLYQAALYLATLPQQFATVADHTKNTETQSEEARQKSAMAFETAFQPVSRRLVSDLRTVSGKVQIRQSPTMKHSICKNCDTMLMDGSTCSNYIENKSKGGKKPWADVLLRRCNNCGFERRFPLTVERQKRQAGRLPRKDQQVENPQVC